MKTVVFSMLACLALAGTVLATPTGTVYIQYRGVSPTSAQLYGDGLTSSGPYVTGVYGFYNGTAPTYPPTGEGESVPVWGFCLDLPQLAPTGAYRLYNVDDVSVAALVKDQSQWQMGDDKADLVYELVGRYWNKDADGNTVDWGTGTGSAVYLSAQAFSFALWEVVYEPYMGYIESQTTYYDVTSFQGTIPPGDCFKAANPSYSAALTLANTWIWSLDGDPNLIAKGSSARAITSEGYQDFLVYNPALPQSNPVIPAPAAIVLGAMGIGLVGIVRRIRRKA